jgi:4-amino-4-deoxy-L-arabinose transferase-like glycosyltransferase
MAAVFLTTSFPYLKWGGSVLTDMGAYFFTVLCLYMWGRVVHESRVPLIGKSEMVLAVLAGVGILAKENVAIIPIFLLTSSLILRSSLKKSVVLAGLCFALPVVWMLLSGGNYFGWYLSGGLSYSVSRGFLMGPRLLVVAFAYAFGWVGAALAAFGFLSEESNPNIRWHMSVIAAGIPVVLSWPIADPRFMFILFPSIIPLAVNGLRWTSHRLGEKPYLKIIPGWVWQTTAVLLYVLANNYLNSVFSFPWKPYVDPAVTR